MKRNSKNLQIAAYILLALNFLLLIGITRNCKNSPSLQKEGFSREDTIDIALIYEPGIFYIYGDSLAGINHDVAHCFCLETNTPYKIWPVSEPSEALEKLEAGNFDILASLPLDNNIKKRFPVSESIFLDRLVLIQLADSVSKEKTVNSSLDLNGKQVHVAAGSSAIHRLKNLSQEIGGKIDIIEVPGLSDELLCLQVASSAISLAVVKESVAKAIAEQYPLLRYDSSVSFTQFQVWVFNPADSLTFQKFNSWFETFHTSDTYLSIIRKY